MSTHMKYSIRRSHYFTDKWCRGRDGFPLYADVMRKIRSKKDNTFLVTAMKPVGRGMLSNQLVSLYSSTLWSSGVRLFNRLESKFQFGQRNGLKN